MFILFAVLSGDGSWVPDQLRAVAEAAEDGECGWCLFSHGQGTLAATLTEEVDGCSTLPVRSSQDSRQWRPNWTTGVHTRWDIRVHTKWDQGNAKVLRP